MPDMSPRARAMREALLNQADHGEASELASDLANRTVEVLNECPVTIATHLLAGALVARALTEIGAAWWSKDIDDCPLDDARSALLSVQLDPPRSIIGRIDNIRERGWEGGR